MGRFGPSHRKIPVPRRHGVRDPLKRLAEKEAAVKDKINNPPKEHDVQEVSNSFKRFVQLKDNSNRDSDEAPQARGRERPKIRVGSTLIQKQKKETEQSFLGRATALQQELESEVKFGVKFGIEVERDERTGAIHIRKRKGTDVDEMLKKELKKAKGGKGVKKVSKEATKTRKPTMHEKRTQKKQQALERKRREEDLLLREYQYDNVAFGEVVNGPPTLNTLPRRADKQDGGLRPGSKRLLLHALMDPKSSEKEEQALQPSKRTPKATAVKIDLKGKRKNLPLATRMKLERDQQSVIEMYRQLKKKVPK
ncbi:uncharacterized protein LOC131208886 [Anopheles bellator]|uniref:uncharacterized protein LOC131208886 n=1 Tax=Anopheles bellator TaxID=139047 RepID=UPI0026496FD8|nr:uncharacterized protein LOC131208886 [Anopheles bellator]